MDIFIKNMQEEIKKRLKTKEPKEIVEFLDLNNFETKTMYRSIQLFLMSLDDK